MPTSDPVYVWTWLPGERAPVPAGALQRWRDTWRFAYGRSYLAHSRAVALGPELPLRSGDIEPAPGLTLAGCLRDALPDAWGQRVLAREHGLAGEPGLRESMLLSGTDRFGAIDFQPSASTYVPRLTSADLDELHEAAYRLESGQDLSDGLAHALLHGTSIGGARPKALVHDQDGASWLAKFSSTSDRAFSVVGAEAAAIALAGWAGIRVPDARVEESLGRRVLLVRRFDRGAAGARRHVLSGLTLCGLHEDAGRYATYPDLLDALRERGGDAGPDLFDRLVFNIAISNNDDHARNHAAFWDGEELTLTPAYDLAPGLRSGDTSFQAMAFGREGQRESRFATLIDVAHVYGLDRRDASDRVDDITTTMRQRWDEAADLGHLTRSDRSALWGRQFLNPAA